MPKGKAFNQLGKEDRIKIEVLLNQGISLRRIAIDLGRPVSTISREVSRNGPQKYMAMRAQYFSEKRHRQKAKRVIMDESMRRFIAVNLRDKKWSPELISAKGREIRSDFISCEWVYHWIWMMKFSQARSDKEYRELYLHLKNGRRRRKRGRKRNMRGNIIGRRWIDQRNAEANKRESQGHLEADIMLGINRQPGLLVVLDRKSRKTWIRKLPIKNAPFVIGKITKIATQIGHVKSITFDNDQSFAEHYKLHHFGIETFFTNPYSSQEKGSVENRIGVIRRFFPKKTDFTRVSADEVKRVEKLINDRPMRMFNYLSPNEVHISVPYKTKN